MPLITPNSRLRLLQSTDLNGYKEQYDFPSISDQTSFFMSLTYREFQDFRFVRQDNAVKLPISYSSLTYYDYVMYQNQAFGNKWFYAFINRIEYISDDATMIYLETDCWQTWQFNVNYRKCFISQGMENPYLAGTSRRRLTNLIPEQLEYGRDYGVTHTEVFGFNSYYALICSSVDLTKPFGSENEPSLSSADGGLFDKMPSMLSYYAVSIIEGNTPVPGQIRSVFEELKDAPWIAQNIQSITIVPVEVIGGDNLTTVTMPGGTAIYEVNNGMISKNATIGTVNDPLQYFGDYVNSKLYTYPYSFIEMTCYNGNQVIIRPECIGGNGDLRIDYINQLGASPRLAYYVYQYNNQGDNGHDYDGLLSYGDFLDTSVVNGNYPQLPVAVDNYLLYMANNANSFALANNINNYNKKESVVMGAIEGGAGAISSLLSGNVGGAVSSLYSGAKSAYKGIKNAEINIRQQMAKIQDAEISPIGLAGQTGGDAFNISNGITGVTLKWKTVKPIYREILDDYFTRYGYKQNSINYPSVFMKRNKNFNYIKTDGCVLGGNVPLEDMEVIKAMFDNGVTMWHRAPIGAYNDNPYIAST